MPHERVGAVEPCPPRSHTAPPRMLSVSHSMAFSRTSASGSVASGLVVALGECLLRLVRLVRVGVGGRPVGPPILLRFGLALTFLAFLVFGDGTRLAALDGGRSETVAALGSTPKATRHSYTSEWPMAAAKLRHTGTHSAHRQEEDPKLISRRASKYQGTRECYYGS